MAAKTHIEKASSSVVKQNRHHDCALCLEKFKSPRILPCFHTFCLECLKHLKSKQKGSNTFACPTCRETINIPPKGVEAFQVNFYIEAEVEVSTSHKCEMCENAEAKHKCIECEQFACENCTRIHATIKATRSHTVVNFDSLKSGIPSSGAVTKDRFCGEHPSEKMRFYCTQCSAVICRDCKLTAHDHHTTTDLSKKAEGARDMLLSLAKESNDVLRPMLEKVLNEAEEHKQALPQKFQQIQEKLEQKADEIIKEVQKCLNEALKHLKEVNSEVSKTVSNSVEEMQQQLAGFQSFCQHVELVAQIGCDADVLELPSQVSNFFVIQQTGNQTPLNFNNGNVIPRLSHFTDDNWRNAIDVVHTETRPRQLLNQNLFSSHGNYVQQTIDISAVSTHIENYIGKLERADKIEIPNTNTFIQATAQMGGFFAALQQSAQPGAQIMQEIRKIQQILIAWRARPETIPVMVQQGSRLFQTSCEQPTSHFFARFPPQGDSNL